MQFGEYIDNIEKLKTRRSILESQGKNMGTLEEMILELADKFVKLCNKLGVTLDELR